MKLSIDKEEKLTIVTILESRLDASIAPEFKLQMQEIIKEGSNDIILDISDVKFMDSSSLGTLVVVLKSLGNHKKLVVCGISGVVLELFKLTRMDKVFNLADDIVNAKRHLM